MSFLAPLAFAFALFLPVIALFYVLRLRRTAREVSSTLLWKKAAEDFQANSPFQKLRRNLLLLLQLIIAGLLVLGLARPFLNMSGEQSRSLVLMIDHSASMSARDSDNGKSRLDEAKERALDAVGAMRPGDQALVIAFAEKAEVLVQFSADRARLEDAVRSIRPTGLSTRAADALALGISLARPHGSEVIVYSDGAFSDAHALGPGEVPVHMESVGSGSQNAGIVALDLRRAPERPDEYQIFATIRNYRSSPLDANLEVLNNGKLVDVRPLRVEARGEAPHVFTSGQIRQGRLELRLTGHGPDVLASDDAAYAIVKPPRSRRVLLVSAGNYFLERALSQVPGRALELIKVTPDQYRPEAQADLVIFDGVAPPADSLVAGNYLFIRAMPPLPGFEDLGEESSPAIFDWDVQHPVMRHVELGDVQIHNAKRYKLPKAAEVLAESRDAPLVAAYSQGDLDLVLWSFDLFETNLPLRVAFPILASNTINWLMRQPDAGSSSAVASTGDLLSVEAPPEVTQVTMADPAGRMHNMSKGSGGTWLFGQTLVGGFYQAYMDGKAADQFGVNLTDESESNIAPRHELASGKGEVVRAASGKGKRTSREIWSWFALAALLVLALEWAVFHRRLMV